MLIHMWKTAHLDRVLHTEITFKDFPETFGKLSIFFISDIHKRKVSDSIINQALGKADLVVIGGDLTENRVPFSQVEENIIKLKTIGPAYFVWGNNDYETDYHLLDATLLNHGVKILDNTAVMFESAGGEVISLLGIDYLNGKKARLDLALADAETDSFKILLSHHPSIIKQVKEDSGIMLVLAGHTHGGQIRIFGRGLYELGGLKEQRGIKLLTSNGYGTSLLPLRLGAKPETHLIHLRKDLK
ncbi:metallophosphoesterase [Peribacillus saganii]|uniref:Metallophosphoesterase n=2 Tax=Peribacillus saganii TaxID=2303992 RepID=A0A372LBJ5_9BACI|nr:metallophosphoesterase [Peribacillus saganii]